MSKSPKKDLRSPLAKARDEWFESPDGERCITSYPVYQPKYLRNMLELAFLAGASAQEKILADKVLEKPVKIVRSDKAQYLTTEERAKRYGYPSRL